jgi:hypothetical protein
MKGMYDNVLNPLILLEINKNNTKNLKNILKKTKKRA